MTDSDKIGVIFSKVSKIETDVALIKQRDETTETWKNTQEGRMAAIEDFVGAYKIERAKLMGVAVASGTIFSGFAALIVWIVSLFKQ